MRKKAWQKILSIVFITLYSVCTINIARAKKVGAVTGFPLPRFVSTKSTLANVRTGPGRRYPIKFILHQKVPLKIIDEYGNWRKIKDWEGEEGWIHRLLLHNDRLGIVRVPITGLYEKQDTKSRLKARLSRNVILLLKTCNQYWCYVDNSTIYTLGYVQTKDIWGILKGEIIE